MKAIIFDFGGTLDLDGIHWSIKFFDAYCRAGLYVPERVFRNAFILSERDMKGQLSVNAGFQETLFKQVYFQLRHLMEDYNLRFFDEPARIAEKISYECYMDVKKNVSDTREILSRLSENYVLGLISNFYGNLKSVMEELELDEFFSVKMDSEQTGLRKPDPKAYLYLLDRLSFTPEELVMVGDSYNNDILPSKNLGLNTIWLKSGSWDCPEDYSKADFLIGSLTEVEDTVSVMERMNYRKRLLSCLK
ncbi:MAG: HAD family hydrolase [Ignavibacteria bacterium]|jgi:putative hydrolase of the HAD superfamily|nr:HAD family hydrolase [Ignavibacteria bacterium]MCU7503899.1 HAD family hydrolase [Ignavibacteria bacterium]MCU7515880.1 HAD family hydrolase [Ignavibacteria bacterium]